jgi:probable rRNA maturation factor
LEDRQTKPPPSTSVEDAVDAPVRPASAGLRDAVALCSVAVDDAAYVVDAPLVAAIARRVREALGVADHELAISFVDARAIKQLNREFREIDRPTDVLSFSQREFAAPRSARAATADAGATETVDKAKTKARRGPPPQLGDVVISLAEAARNAADIGQALDREAAFLLVHGILHLCGHDHHEPDEERAMLAEQETLMTLLAHLPIRTAAAPAWTGCVRMRPSVAAAGRAATGGDER